MICGSAILTLSTGLNAITLHATCTAVFVAVAAIITVLLASVRTLEKIRFLGWGGLISIMAALGVLVIGVAVGDRPDLAPKAPEPFVIERILFGSPGFAQAMGAVSNIFWAFTGTSALYVLPQLRARSVR
jgi:drug/metabolite transporter (DMT)-like permease